MTRPVTFFGFMGSDDEFLSPVAAPQDKTVADLKGTSELIAAQSCELLLEPTSGFFSDVQLDEKGGQAVMDLRSKLGEGGCKLDEPSKYIDRQYWQPATRK